MNKILCILWAFIAHMLIISSGEHPSENVPIGDPTEIRVLRQEMENMKNEMQLMRTELRLCSSDRDVIRKVENDHVILHWVQTNLHDLRSELSEMEKAMESLSQKSAEIWMSQSKTDWKSLNKNNTSTVSSKCI